MTVRTPRLQEVIANHLKSARRNLPTLLPAEVVKWDTGTQKADCQILIQDVTYDEEGNRVVTSWPVVPCVPVQFLGAGGYRVTCPISDGSSSKATTGSLIFGMRSMDKWLTGNGSEVDPEFDHDHEISDAVFFPGLLPFGAPWQSCPTDHMTAGADTGVQIHFRSNTISIGDETGNDFIALASKVDTELTKISTTLASLTGGASSAASFATAYSKGAVASSQAKAK